MCKIVDDFAAKQVKEARIETAKAKAKEFAIELWNYGIRDVEKIAEMTKLPLDEVKEMFKGESA